MKYAITAIAMMCALRLAAATVCSGPLPESSWADTETSTNIPLSVCANESRILSFSMSLFATPSNNVQVAAGCDADGNGSLGIDETGLVVGWDCGEWVVRGPGFEEGFRAEPATGGASKHLELRLWAKPGAVREIAASENGQPLAFGFPAALPAWAFDDSWDMLRFTARGTGAPCESCVVRLNPNGTAISLR